MKIQNQLREMLRGEHSDGLTMPEIMELTGWWETSVCKALKAMPDIYRDRWQDAVNSLGRRYTVPVYCVVVPPPDCPRPPTSPRKAAPAKPAAAGLGVVHRCAP